MDYNDIKLVKMNYDTKSLSSFIDQKFDELEKNFTKNPNAVDSTQIDIAEKGKEYKLPTFFNEKEYRLVLPGEKQKNIFRYRYKEYRIEDDKILFKLNPIDYFTSNGEIKSYYTLDFKSYLSSNSNNNCKAENEKPGKISDIISSITIGPKCSESIDDINRFISTMLSLREKNIKNTIKINQKENEFLSSIFSDGVNNNNINSFDFTEEMISPGIVIKKSNFSLK